MQQNQQNQQFQQIQQNFYYNPDIWGPHYWFFLHTIALTYPNYPNATTKKIYYEFFRNFSRFIPVDKIAEEYTKLLDRFPIVPYLDDRQSLIKWVHFVHNQVNRRMERPTLTMDEFLRAYYHLYDPPARKANRALTWRLRALFGCTLVALVILIYYLWFRG